jgi:hypothetical protein
MSDNDFKYGSSEEIFHAEAKITPTPMKIAKRLRTFHDLWTNE